MSDSGYEIVHTITDWYDGARGGVADLNGKPHYYECQFDDATDNYSATYFLQSLDPETLVLALEDWQIWLRWDSAFKQHKATIETHPALPADRERHDELSRLLADRPVIGEGRIKATSDFKYGEPTLVKMDRRSLATQPNKSLDWSAGHVFRIKLGAAKVECNRRARSTQPLGATLNKLRRR